MVDSDCIKRTVSVLREEQVVNYPYWALRELAMNAVTHRYRLTRKETERLEHLKGTL